MDKDMLFFIILGFWLFLPIPMMMLNIGGYSTELTTTTNSKYIIQNNPTSAISNFFNIYVNLLVFNIDGVNIFIIYAIRFLQLITLLLVADKIISFFGSIVSTVLKFFI